MILQLLIDSALLGGLYALLALGLVLSFGVTNILNFAHGEAIMLGAYGAFWAFTLWGIDPLLSIPIMLVVGFGAGFVCFRYVIERSLDAPHLNQILLTFGIGLILQNAAVLAWTGDLRSANPSYSMAAINLAEVFIPVGRLLTFTVAAALAAILYMWLTRTEYGRASRAIAQNERAAKLMGIDTRFVYSLVFAISIAVAAATGAALSSITTITPFIGFHLLVKAFAIMVLGGAGSISGAVLGGVLLGLLETTVAYYVPEGSGWAEGVAFVALFLFLLIRPQGLIGTRVHG
ncbi:branched-chain amino acid ABC transporter permease [Chelatococcus asaccharovorans]|uniref:Amino acid/amide ABC transporter membrane protein 1 (HAAT family) n=1 Tax=Chelatococcus asaccharovorans TaxID=28210 RepID=A0A2V3TSL4_9HYPH|nr:branched-chain amino acid ABC transporter permease [Chelatococcus asaccharovorans]MBS7707969.1 branched-chain amino acid ABC transporter permease [Chelatococcus asaccharovorans]PXW50288.1 amino acid/amide ABC transporter membrane protein 1 (HAAT family) [Chelatococcus asaccharovorans]